MESLLDSSLISLTAMKKNTFEYNDYYKYTMSINTNGLVTDATKKDY